MKFTTQFLLFLFILPILSFGQVSFGDVNITPRMRVIVDNDYGGDPDGLFMLAHMLMSPSVEIRAVVGSHLREGDGFDPSDQQAVNAVQQAKKLMEVMGVEQDIPVVQGSNTGMVDESTPIKTDAVDFIIQEARRTDTELPLFVVCGGGLTEIASALLTAPDIADKLTLVWIGGPEYTDISIPPPGYSTPEYNLNIDINAGQAVFNQTEVMIWQVPRNAYRQPILSYAELVLKVKPLGETGAYLTGLMEDLMRRINPYVNMGETYIYGDNPLVLLTALQSPWESDPSSSFYAIRESPLINDDGIYQFNHAGRPIRVYYDLDVELLFNDFLAKLELLALE